MKSPRWSTTRGSATSTLFLSQYDRKRLLDGNGQRGEHLKRTLSDKDYERLLAFRTELRRFQRWSEERAKDLGLTTAQHQLLLAVRGHPGPEDPTIGELAGHLLVRHHTVVGLIDRTQALGLVRRASDAVDQRVVRLRLTDAGRKMLQSLSHAHLAELARLGPLLDGLADLG